jgi:type I restriction enzyme S subunit
MGKLVVNRPDLIDGEYLYYLFLSPSFNRYLFDTASGTKILHTSPGRIEGFEVWLLPLSQQRDIAAVLRALDDKIELNRCMNETLEAIARAIFKSRFVDFAPVRAKADSQQPSVITQEIANLFTASFAESPVGKIPAGWQVRPIGEVTRVVGGSTPRTEEPAYWQDGQIAWATPKDLSSLNSPVLLDTERHITEKGLAQISSGLLPKGTVLLSSRAPIGYLAVSEVPVAINQGFIALVCETELPNYFVLNWIRANLDEIKAHANGTTFLEISKANFRPLLVALPPPPLIKEFVRLVSPLYERLVTNLRESGTLARTRDLLIPKLLSGEIQIKQAEKVVEAHA